MDFLNLTKNKKIAPFVSKPKFCCLCKLEGLDAVAFYWSMKNYYCEKHRDEAVEEIKKVSQSRNNNFYID